MDTLAPTSKIDANTNTRELYFAIAGFWTLEEMKAFLTDLSKAAIPFIKKGETFTSMGNLVDFVPQDRATADAIRDSLLLATQNGLVRFAVVSPPPLVKMQYRRIGAGLDFDFFDDEASARKWLRGVN
ncbi:MAG: STAS/SEC14 domain-containing protein [Pseudomonadota bacterium]